MSLTPGNTYYTPQGAEVVLVATLRDDELYVVRPFTADEDDDAEYLCFGQLHHTAAPAIDKLDPQVAQLTVKRDALLTEVTQLTKERDALRKMGPLCGLADALENLELFLSGKITHFVTCPSLSSSSPVPCFSYSGIQISRWGTAPLNGVGSSNSSPSRPEDMRLLSLFGKATGDVCWGMNTYRDSSGTWMYCIPCVSLKDAVAKAAGLYDTLLADVRATAEKTGVISDSDLKGMEASLRCLRTVDVERSLPEDILLFMKAREIAQQEQEVYRLQAQLKYALAKLGRTS